MLLLEPNAKSKRGKSLSTLESYPPSKAEDHHAESTPRLHNSQATIIEWRKTLFSVYEYHPNPYVLFGNRPFCNGELQQMASLLLIQSSNSLSARLIDVSKAGDLPPTLESTGCPDVFLTRSTISSHFSLLHRGNETNVFIMLPNSRLF